MTLRGRSLTSLLEWETSDVAQVLQLAHALKHEKKSRVFKNRLAHRNIALIFEKPSTRTRCAFVTACQDEGAHAECLGLTDIHLGEKESTEDTARVLGRFFDGIQFRGFAQSTVETLAKYAGVPVWNGLTDDEHPTQILADLMTLQERFGELRGRKLVYLGDGANNVAQSLMVGACQFGMHFVVASPSSLRPQSRMIDACERLCLKTGATLQFTDNPEAAVQNACALYTDVWVSMGQEDKPGVQSHVASLKPFQINPRLMAATGTPQTVLLHCLPANKGMEVTSDVFESSSSLVFDQAENRMHTIKALMVSALS